MVNRELQKIRLKSDRKFHDKVVWDIFENPPYLNIEGLDSDTLIWKALTHSTSKAEIMVLGKQTLEELLKIGVFNQLDAYRFKVAQRAGNRSSFVRDIGNRDLVTASTGSSLSRQGNMAPLL